MLNEACHEAVTIDLVMSVLSMLNEACHEAVTIDLDMSVLRGKTNNNRITIKHDRG